MKFRPLGTTSVSVSVIGQGTMGIGGFFSKDTSNDSESIRCIETGIDLGMNFIDTAEVYGAGHSEKLVGKAVHGKRESVVIATKFSPENSRYDQVIKSAEASLRRLNTDWIDLYQFHWPNPAVTFFETMDALAILKEQGKIRSIGVSNFSYSQFQDVKRCGEEVVSNQVEYNLFDRGIETGMLQYFAENGETIIAYSPLDQGNISQGGEKDTVLKKTAEKYGKKPSQIVLNWLINHQNVIAIPKSTNPDHISLNAEAADFKLVSSDIEELNRIFYTKPISIPIDTPILIEITTQWM